MSKEKDQSTESLKNGLGLPISAASTLVAFVLAIFFLGAGSADAQNASIKGCWKKTDFNSQYLDTVVLCFKSDRTFDGAISDKGHGIDLEGTWILGVNDRLIFDLNNEGELMPCRIDNIKPNDYMYLNDCEVANYSGFYKSIKLDN